jgi:hypothetical protein
MERDFDAGIAPVELVPQDMRRVFLNRIGLGFNAAHKRRHGAGEGFSATLKVTTRDLGNEVEIRVRDNGTGIAPEFRDKLFQPSFYDEANWRAHRARPVDQPVHHPQQQPATIRPDGAGRVPRSAITTSR